MFQNTFLTVYKQHILRPSCIATNRVVYKQQNFTNNFSKHIQQEQQIVSLLFQKHKIRRVDLCFKLSRLESPEFKI